MASNDADQALQALQAVEAYYVAFNRAERDLILPCLQFPLFVLPTGAQAVIYHTADEYRLDLAGLRAREGWDHSTLGARRVIAASPGKVECLVQFSRFRADGTEYLHAAALYIVTEHEGRWGIQVISLLAEVPDLLVIE